MTEEDDNDELTNEDYSYAFGQGRDEGIPMDGGDGITGRWHTALPRCE